MKLSAVIVLAVSAGGVLAASCVASENPRETATSFISRCRKAGIRQVFPAQHYNNTLGDIKNCASGTCKTAWKLLNDNRFKK
ncbi:hypothetical protein GQ42DRAFT_160568 [Ramicandelaber brevisporus]|nr:hypothetical protein GQ42DRAFT_160568 [Ramicandelaber brevisporus]